MNIKNSVLAVLGLTILATLLVLTGAQEVQGQAGTKEVVVINNQEQPVPTIQLGTARIEGTVNVENLPLDPQGNLRTSTQSPTRFAFKFLLLRMCLVAPSTAEPFGFCGQTTDIPVDINANLQNLGSQGWELLDVSVFQSSGSGFTNFELAGVLYTLRRPIDP